MNSIKKTKKKSKSINFDLLYNTLDKLNNKLEESRLNVNFSIKSENELLDEIEIIQTKIYSNKDLYYPSIYDLSIKEKLFLQNDFNIFKIEKPTKKINKLLKQYQNIDVNLKKKKEKPKQFNISDTQIMLKNFMSKHSLYRSLLIFHGTGVGKTCSAITIAENLKPMVKDNKKKIYIIRYEEFKSQIFDSKQLKDNNVKFQCTKDSYTKELVKKDKSNEVLLDKCKDNKKNCDSVILKIKKLIKEYYEFKNFEKWAKDTSNTIYKYKSSDKQEEHLQKIKQIKKDFSNSVIIIDEAHHLNSTVNNSEIKLINKVLTDVLKYGNNIRLILLTATPIWDKPTDILSLINYMLINDNRTILKHEDIFNSKGELKSGSKKILNKKINGYISYLRGDNPFEFPLRISSKFNVPEQIIKKYPTNLIETTTITGNKKKKFELFDIIDCPMDKTQKDVYNKIIKLKKEKEEASTVWATETQVSNFVYQSLKDANDDFNDCYGEQGFKSITIKNKDGSYYFKEEDYGLNFIGDKLIKLSNKIATIIKNIEKSDGPVFIYSNYIWGGLCPVILALEMNGYRRYKSHNKPFLNNKYKSTDYKGDYIIKSGTIKSANINDYLLKKENMINENVKVFLGTETASEGLSLFGYREVHILEPHFNFSLIEQVIGRAIRNKSHLSLPINRRNVSVYLYASTIGKDESVDLFKYRISEHKASIIGQIEKILKENAFDCFLNYYGNNIFTDLNRQIKIITSQGKEVKLKLDDTPYSRLCNYSDKCTYYCDGNKKKTLSILEKTSNEKILYITNIRHIIQKIKNEIISLVLEYLLIKIDDIKKIMKLNNKYDELFDISIIIILKDNKIYDNNHYKGKIIKHNEFMKFISLDNKNPNIEYIEQHYKKYKKKNINEIDMRFYINKIKNYNLELEKKEVYDYEAIFEKLKFEYEKVKYKLPNKYDFYDNISDNEILTILFYRLLYNVQLLIIKNILSKYIQNKNLNKFEQDVFNLIEVNHIITKKEFNKIVYFKKTTKKKTNVKGKLSKKTKKVELYGFILYNYKGIQVFSYDIKKKQFNNDIAYNTKILDYRLKKFEKKYTINKLFGYITIDNKNTLPVFKIMDLRDTNKKSQKGSKCIDKKKEDIKQYYKLLTDKQFIKKKKHILCNNLELLFRRKDALQPKKWFLNSIEYSLYLKIKEKEN